MPDLEFPTWTGSGGPADAAWNTVLLGNVKIPGICTVSSLKCGIDVKTKKAKGADGPTSTDNGVDASKFVIEVWLNESHWPDWLKVVGKIHPRRPGRKREPLEIKHPEPNVLGISIVRVLSITGSPPTGRGGKKYKIEVEEWFEEPKPVKKNANGKEIPETIKTGDYFGDPNVLARKLAEGQPQVLPPDDKSNIAANLY
jgi:hypothetical protein